MNYSKKYPEKMHPSVEKAIDSGNTPYSNHNSIPSPSYIPEIASKRFTELLQKIRSYYTRPIRNVEDIAMSMMTIYNKILKIESEYIAQLTDLAVSLIEENYGILSEEVKFNITLGSQNIIIDPGEKDDDTRQQKKLAPLDPTLKPEAEKRTFINAMIQGGALRGQYLFHLIEPELSIISPELVQLYGIISSVSEYMYWVIPVSIKSGFTAGIEKLDLSEDKPIIVVKAVIFPILLQELSKGVLELVSAHGLHQSKNVRQLVLPHTDTLKNETWGIRFGPVFWNKFLQATSTLDPRTRMKVYEKIVKLPADKFHNFIKGMLSDSPESLQQLQQFISQQASLKFSLINLSNRNDEVFQNISLIEKYAGLEEKMPYLLKLVPNEIPDKQKYVLDAAQADPTLNKSYTIWLLTQINKKQIRLPEDQDRVKGVLEFFFANKQRWEGEKDINKYDFHTLEDQVDERKEKINPSKREQIRQVKEEGVRLLYDESPYKVFQILTPEAASQVGYGTKWCTTNPNTAQSYLSSGPLYIITKNGEKVTQIHIPTKQAMDVKDRTLNLTPQLQNIFIKALLNDGNNLSEDVVYSLLFFLSNQTTALLPLILRSPKATYVYAKNFLKSRWKEGEDTLLKSPVWAALYAKDIIKKRWPAAEKIIHSSPEASSLYKSFLPKKSSNLKFSLEEEPAFTDMEVEDEDNVNYYNNKKQLYNTKGPAIESTDRGKDC